MPRIRTLKPEFFRSPDTAKVDFPVRIFYQALWCWADDFGIGETNINGLLGFAFPDEDEFTAQDLRRFCADCAQHFQVTFYTVRGRHYYAIPTWEKHQKLERRTARRKHPLPDDPDAVPDQRFQPSADSARFSRGLSGAESALEQGKGNRGKGTGEQNPPNPPNEPEPEQHPRRATGAEIARSKFALIPSSGSPLAGEIVRAYAAHIRTPLDAKTGREMSTVVDTCLQAGQTPDEIAAGIEAWSASDSWSPSQIPKFIAKAAAARRNQGVGKPTQQGYTTEQLADELIAEMRQP